MTRTSGRHVACLVACGAVIAALATGCSATGGAEGLPTATHAADSAFVITSADFVDGGELPESAKAIASDGQCDGFNDNPQLAWSGAPDGTVVYALTMIDVSAEGFVHWLIADIPSSVTDIDDGGSAGFLGVPGASGVGKPAYFGPCPPDADHHYVFTVYALDDYVGLDPRFSVGELGKALNGHVLAQASITGLASPTPLKTAFPTTGPSLTDAATG